MQKYIRLILAVVTTSALSQLLLKQGMLSIGAFDFSTAVLMQTLPRVMLNPYVIGGLLTLVFQHGLALHVLSRVEISFAYPFLSVSSSTSKASSASSVRSRNTTMPPC